MIFFHHILFGLGIKKGVIMGYKNGMEIDSLGNIQHWVNGKRHREDGPAIEWSDGDKWWYLNGERVKNPSYCCQKCGEQIGWLGRIFNYFVKWHKCEEK